ncbi:Clp protease N-terminal domain-containing protein [Streptomyces boncukensis]|uniref:Clp R domain-containing protein n=1 Tax=Streptomyces boncukensis TaxID=2711219 RepID=A0A6G4WZ80_9ACTN|nr:Clp protease N-terminal domain-containing protein [Streptomyces boncukensis]NGO70428.1 hypothetical protein [Streptomyces boncukensis]
MFERFTTSARESVIGAQEEARSLRHDRIGAEHLLLAALRSPGRPGAATLVRLGATAASCRSAVLTGAPAGDRPPRRTRHLPFTRSAKEALKRALHEAGARSERRIGVEHLVLALLGSDDEALTAVLRRLGIDPAEARERVAADLGRTYGT